MQVARVTDKFSGVCTCHKSTISMEGEIANGSLDGNSGGLGIARVGDTVIGDCGHTGTIVSGSISNTINGKGKAIITSKVTGCLVGEIVTGNPTHNTGL